MIPGTSPLGTLVALSGVLSLTGGAVVVTLVGIWIRGNDGDTAIEQQPVT